MTQWVMGAVLVAFFVGSVQPTIGSAATIQGIAFEDINENGDRETCEPVLANHPIFVRDNTSRDNYQYETDQQGKYQLSVPNAGPFSIWTNIPVGQRQTSPNEGEGFVKHDFTIASSSETQTKNFGLFDPSRSNSPPTINAGPDVRATMHKPFTFDLVSITDPDPCDNYTVSWDFGDGTAEVQTTTSRTSHTYTRRRPYEVIIAENDNRSNSASLRVTVVGSPPVVKLPDDIALDATELHRFQPISLSDQDGQVDSSADYEYVWEFGDSSHPRANVPNLDADVSVEESFDQAGTYPVTLRVISDEGSGSDQMTVNVRGTYTEPCARGVAQVVSRQQGSWNSPNTWSTGQVPTTRDWVRIRGGHQILLPQGCQQHQVMGLCIEENGELMNTSSPRKSNSSSCINLYGNIHNKGRIVSGGGLSGNTSGNGSGYESPTDANNIEFWGTKFQNEGTIGCDKREPCDVLNLKKRQGGDGGNDQSSYLHYAQGASYNPTGGNGAQIEIYAASIINTGTIRAGHGGNANTRRNSSGRRYVEGRATGGKGGDINITPSNLESSQIRGTVITGCGGSAYARSSSLSVVGTAGVTKINTETVSGIIQGCNSEATYWDPIKLTATETTRFEGSKEVVIYADEGGSIDLTRLSEGAISATETITISVGEGGVVDLPTSGKVFSGKQIDVFADTIRLNGNTLTVAEAQEALKAVSSEGLIFNIAPSKILYSTRWSYAKHKIDEAGATVRIEPVLFNESSSVDTYTLSVTDSKGWKFTSLPNTVTVKGLSYLKLRFYVTLPETSGAEDVFTVTATSQGDPKVSAVSEIRVGVRAEEEEIITPPRGDEKSDMTVVIEDTARMTGKLIMVSNALETFLINQFDNEGEGPVNLPTVELITFKDEAVSRVVTDNIGRVIGWLRGLQPAGGDDCPNASVAGLESALEHIRPNGQIILVTASSPHKDAAAAIAKAQQQKVKVQVMLLDSCDNEAADKAVYKSIADETGGTFNWASGNVTSVGEFENIISTVVTNTATEVEEQVEQASVKLTITSPAHGTVTGSGINCPTDTCSATFRKGDSVTLNASENAPYQFVSWSGDCAGATAELTVTLDEAKSCTATFAEIPNEPPTATFTITPESGEAPLTVALDGSASTDTDGNIVSYVWTSDGQKAKGQNAKLTFSEVRDYTITLEVTDNNGATNSATKNVKVEAPLQSQHITDFNTPSQAHLFGDSLTFKAQGGASGNSVTFSSKPPLICEIGGNGVTLYFNRTGTCEVTANQDGNEQFLAAEPVTKTIQVVDFIDNDNDGLDDIWEELWGVDDPNGDPDGDGRTNLEEYNNNTNPTSPD